MVESEIVLADTGFVATLPPFSVWIVIFGEQSPDRTVNGEVLNASFVAGAEVTSEGVALAASSENVVFVALTVKG